jgi:hypothetical protein
LLGLPPSDDQTHPKKTKKILGNPWVWDGQTVLQLLFTPGRYIMKIYHGERTARSCEVTVDGRPLRMRSDLTGNATHPFDWGYIGTGQLSVALLSDFLGDDAKAKALAGAFEQKVVAELPKPCWTRTDLEFAAALEPLIGGDGNHVHDVDVSARAAFGEMPIETTFLAAQDAEGAASRLNEDGH